MTLDNITPVTKAVTFVLIKLKAFLYLGLFLDFNQIAAFKQIALIKFIVVGSIIKLL
jgi:hypothetical protein